MTTIEETLIRYSERVGEDEKKIADLEAQRADLLAALEETVHLLDANAIAVSGEENHHPIVKRARAAIERTKP